MSVASRPLTDIFPVFVGHIHSSAAPADLRSLFERLGEVVEVAILAEHGFVNFASASSARQAIERFNGRRLKGQRLHVDYSEELLRYIKDDSQKENRDHAHVH